MQKQEHFENHKDTQETDQQEDFSNKLKALSEEIGSSSAITEQLNEHEKKTENQIEAEQTIEASQEERRNILTDVLTSEIISNGLDLVPFAGGGKMLVESMAGRTLSGQKMTGKERVIHGAMGAGSLAIDLTGIGEAKDATIIAGKSLGLLERLAIKIKEKGSIKGAKIFSATLEFMRKHPQLVTKAEKFAETKLREQITKINEYRGQAA